MHSRFIRYMRAGLVAESPLKLSSGREGITDSDILLDTTGRPYIPGTTLCGVIRHHASALHPTKDETGRSYADRWFGYLVDAADEGQESSVVVLDAFPTGVVGPIVSVRDGVGLDEFKTAQPQAKYDYQVVNAGARFRLRMAVRYEGEDERNEVDDFLYEVIEGFDSGDVLLGGKTSRGFGRVRVENPEMLDIDLATSEGVARYVSFNWKSSEFSAFQVEGTSDAALGVYEKPLRVPLELASTLLVRTYATLGEVQDTDKLVDAEALKRPDGSPVIPGSSWAGAFRAHMLRILQAAGYDDGNSRGDTAQAFLARVFGTVDGPRAVASKIVFSESVVEGSHPLNVTRTAIDRFTGGAADKRLFTTRPSVGGTTELVIRWRRNMDQQDKALLESMVKTCVADLTEGYLAIGGNTAVGAGMFREGRASR